MSTKYKHIQIKNNDGFQKKKVTKYKMNTLRVI